MSTTPRHRCLWVGRVGNFSGLNSKNSDRAFFIGSHQLLLGIYSEIDFAKVDFTLSQLCRGLQ